METALSAMQIMEPAAVMAPLLVWFLIHLHKTS